MRKRTIGLGLQQEEEEKWAENKTKPKSSQGSVEGMACTVNKTNFRGNYETKRSVNGSQSNPNGWRWHNGN